MADPDLQIRRGWGGGRARRVAGHPHLEIGGGPSLQKNFFLALKRLVAWDNFYNFYWIWFSQITYKAPVASLKKLTTFHLPFCKTFLIFNTSSSGKLLGKFQDFLKNSRLCSNLACVASVFVWVRSKGRSRSGNCFGRAKNGTRATPFFARTLTLVPRSLLRNSTLPQANTSTERFHSDMKILMFSLSVVCLSFTILNTLENENGFIKILDLSLIVIRSMW